MLPTARAGKACIKPGENAQKDSAWYRSQLSPKIGYKVTSKVNDKTVSKEVNYILEQSSKQGNEKAQRRQLKFTGLWKEVGNYDSWEREISMRRNRNTGRMRVLEGQIIRYYKHTSYGQEDGTKYEHTWAQWGVDGWCNFKVKELALDTVALTDNPCTQKVEAGGSLPVWGLLGLHSVSEHGLGYTVRLSKKNNSKKKKVSAN